MKGNYSNGDKRKKKGWKDNKQIGRGYNEEM